MTVEVRSFVDEGLGNSSHLLDLGEQRALVVDPLRDVTPYRAAAEAAGLRIAFTVETHLHADFVTGSRELAARGAQVLAPAGAGIEWPHRGFGHGDELDLGGLRLRALATPGHTPEHLAWLVLDGDRPAVLFSGGALLVDAVARTDLTAPERTEELARSLWRALHEQVLTLPDDVVVHPTHGAGSFCSAPAGGDRVTTIGRERAANPLLASPDEDAFVERLLAGYGSYPPYFLRLRERNRRGPAVLGSPFPELAALDAGEVQRLAAAGGVVIDARPVASWAAGHVPGALSVPLRPQFATWLGWLVEDEQPFAVVLDDDQDGREVARQALTIGHERLSGRLEGGMAAWRAAGFPVATTPLVLAGAVSGRVLDVRQGSEFAGGHLPGALNVELGTLPAAAADVGPGPVAVMCGHGERAATAASVLEAGGHTGVAVVLGGPSDWAAAGGQLEVG